tara:strand:- start:1247 stop:1732 length:486 start_codon:yes stop_codon:yes gene_type:complete
MDNSDTEIDAIDEKKQKRLEHLKAAREKALQVRQANAKDKNRVKDIKQENTKLEKQANENELIEKNKELKAKTKPKAEPIKEEEEEEEPEILVKPKKKTNKKKVILVQSSDDSSGDEKIYMKRVKKKDLFPKKEVAPQPQQRPAPRQLTAIDFARMSLFQH